MLLWVMNLGFAGGLPVVTLLTGGTTGYDYPPPNEDQPTLVVGPAGAGESYQYGSAA